MKRYTDEEWLDICKIEANCHHNDGWTMAWYSDEVKKIGERINKKAEKEEGTCFPEKAFWEDIVTP